MRTPGIGRFGIKAALLAAAASFPCLALAGSLDYEALEALFGEPVTASATGSPQRESDVAATMIIITAEEIRRSGARDIPGVLRHVAGLDALQTSKDHSDFSVRGYNQAFSPRLLVLVDGRQVYADYYGFTPWSTVPVELAAIRQIEVVKGPNSALFGFNAVGGVINIVTHDPVSSDLDTVSVSGGTQDLLQVSALTTWQVADAAGVRLSLGHRQGDDFSTALLSGEAGVRRGNERNAISLDAGLDVGENVRLRLDATYSDARQAEFSPIYAMSYGDYETNSIRGRAAIDTQVGLLQASVYSNSIVTDAFVGEPSDLSFRFDNRVTVAQLESLSRLASGHTLRLSAEYRDNSMETTPIGGGEVFYDVMALGGMWEWQLRPSITLMAAARMDRWSLGRGGSVPLGYALTNDDWDRSDTEQSFNIGLVWQAGDADTVRLLVGRGVQLPNLLTLGGLLLPIEPFGFASGVPDLEPTLVDNYELSWDRRLARLRANLRVSAFYGRSEAITAISGGARPALGLFGTPVNIGDSRTSGAEISLDGTPSDVWRWGLSYKHQEIEDEFDPAVPLQLSFTDFEHTTPRHVVRANLGWTDGRWEVDGYLRYQSEFAGLQSDPAQFGSGRMVRIPGHFTLDGRLGYAVSERVTLALSGKDLTSPEQQQTSAPNVERAVFVTFSMDFGNPE